MEDIRFPRIPLSHLGRVPEPERGIRLLERLRQRLRTRRYSKRTETAYCDWVRRFVLFHDRRHPDSMGEREIGAFLTHLTTVENVSASTQNQALHAILFLYRHVLRKQLGFVSEIAPARRPVRLPVVLSQAEVKTLLGALGSCLSSTFRGGCTELNCLKRSRESFRTLTGTGAGSMYSRLRGHTLTGRLEFAGGIISIRLWFSELCRMPGARVG